jgi:hypothetical protein
MATRRRFTSLKGPMGWGVGYAFFTVAFLCLLPNGAPRYDQVIFVVGASVLLGYLGSLCGVLLTPLPKRKRKPQAPAPLLITAPVPVSSSQEETPASPVES